MMDSDAVLPRAELKRTRYYNEYRALAASNSRVTVGSKGRSFYQASYYSRGGSSFGTTNHQGEIMSRDNWLAIVLAGTMALSGCVSKGNVVYTSADRSISKPSIFMDRAGDLYPPASIEVAKDRMNGLGFYKSAVTSETVATLRAYFKREAENNSRDWRKLLLETQVKSTGDFSRDWSLVQDGLRGAVIDSLRAQRGNEVLLVVHGFNNDHGKANKWLDTFDTRVRELYPNIHIVRLYWDGLTGPKTGIGIWGEAQYNGPRVGQQLRRILNQLGSGIRLRIFTHSSGAYVVTNALGNGGGSYDNFERDPEVKSHAGAIEGDYAIPKDIDDLRVAMLIPAQPLTAFNNYRNISGRNPEHQGVIPQRLILGTSRRDIAASKWVLPCNWFGNTCMAVKPEQACREVRQAMGGNPSSVVVIDFPAPEKGYHDHGVPSYMEDSAQWNHLMGQLFDEEPLSSCN